MMMSRSTLLWNIYAFLSILYHTLYLISSISFYTINIHAQIELNLLQYLFHNQEWWDIIILRY